MPLDHGVPVPPLPRAERHRIGRDLRQVVPRRAHVNWVASADRRDPVRVLIESTQHHLSRLLPIRYNRMRASPFAFFQDAAVVRAMDLANTPSSGLRVQACGDCHLMNFGVCASSDGKPISDVIDFDETLPAPFEWDLKRLATSFVHAGQYAEHQTDDAEVIQPANDSCCGRSVVNCRRNRIQRQHPG